MAGADLVGRAGRSACLVITSLQAGCACLQHASSCVMLSIAVQGAA